MSAAANKQNSWISQNYEKIILILVLITLLGSGVILVGKTGGETADRTRDANRLAAVGEGALVEGLDLSMEEKGLYEFSHPIQSQNYTHQMLVSEERIRCYNPACAKPIPFDAKICPFCKTKQPEPIDKNTLDSDEDGIPNVIEQKYGLDPYDKVDAYLDLDGDGFLNIEEYQAGTDMANAEDSPEPIAKLRWFKTYQHPFNLRFQAVSTSGPNGDINIFQINLRSLERTYFVKMNETIADSSYKLVSYDPEAAAGPTVVLREGNRDIPLIKGRVLKHHEMSVGLVSLLDGKPFRKRVGDSIEMKDRTYKVVDITSNGVIIADDKTGQKTRVGRLTPAEKMELSGETPPPRGVPLVNDEVPPSSAEALFDRANRNLNR